MFVIHEKTNKAQFLHHMYMKITKAENEQMAIGFFFCIIYHVACTCIYVCECGFLHLISFGSKNFSSSIGRGV